MIQTNISLEEDQHKKIKQECFDKGYSLSFFLRELIDNYFKTETLTKNEKEIAEKLGVSEIDFADYKKEEIKKASSISSSSSPSTSTTYSRCKICGMLLNQYGVCNNLAKHKK